MQLAWSPAPQWSTPARWKLITPLPPIPSLPSLSSLLNLPPLASPLPFAVLPSFPPLRSGLLNFQHLPGLPPLHLNPVRAGSKLIRSSKWALNILRRDAERAMKSDNSAYVAE